MQATQKPLRPTASFWPFWQGGSRFPLAWARPVRTTGLDWVLAPRISEFFGLAVYMYWFDTQRHAAPHFYVRYQGAEAVYGLDGAPNRRTLGATGRSVDRRVVWRAGRGAGGCVAGSH
ncbi:MAG: DUF4160 domain-containing protein [Polyangiaceae bacterium]|nr:DUF4160 domain-containing protein [Polyangiaceae bacterium]